MDMEQCSSTVLPSIRHWLQSRNCSSFFKTIWSCLWTWENWKFIF